MTEPSPPQAPPPGPLTPPASPQRQRTLNRKRRAAITLTVIGVVLAVLAGVAIWAGITAARDAQVEPAPAETTAPAETPAPEPEPEPEEPIRVLAMGDMLPHDSVNANAQTDSGWDYAQFFDGIQAELEPADAIFCNQEVPSAGEAFGISGYPVFNAPQELARDLRNGAGCDLINLANNHAADMGVAGIAATREAWDPLEPLSISGANRSAEEQSTIVYGDIRGVRTALVSFAEYSNAAIDGVSVNFMGDTELVTRLLTEARANADLVIVSAHWGTEDTHAVNDHQRANARLFADLGADVVLGTGPHVLQPVEWLDRADGGQTLVWYSLGNMLSTQLSLAQRTGVIASFEVVPGEDGAPLTVANPAATITYMHYDWTAEEEAAGALLARTNLSITPMAGADALLANTRFGVAAPDQVAASAEILGPVVSTR